MVLSILQNVHLKHSLILPESRLQGHELAHELHSPPPQGQATLARPHVDAGVLANMRRMQHVNYAATERNDTVQTASATANTAPTNRRAALVVLASFLLTFTGCGLNFAFGIYQELYETSAGPFKATVSPAWIDLIGTLAVSLMSIGAPFASGWTRIYGPRTVTLCGGALIALANILASFSTQLWHFLLTQGMLLGCGTCLTYIPALTVAPGWFNQRRGTAMGVILSGTGVGGVVWAPLLRYLNATIGFRNTMRATGTMAWLIISLSALCLKWELTADIQRRQENETRAARGRRFAIPLVNWNIARSRTFIAQATGATLQAAAYYTPVYFLSTYARTLGYDAAAGANMIAIHNAASASGKIVVGILADRYGRLNALAACTLLSALSTLGLWLPSSMVQSQDAGRRLVQIFSPIYGIFAGSYVSLFPTALAEQFGVQNFASINGLLYMLRGLGSLIGTPLAGSLIRGYSNPSAQLPSSFENTALFVGCLLCGATLAVFWARVETGARSNWSWRM